jgi:hypothetical protein
MDLQDRPVVGFCEHGNEPSGVLKGGGGGIVALMATISFSNKSLLQEKSLQVKQWYKFVWIQF